MKYIISLKSEEYSFICVRMLMRMALQKKEKYLSKENLVCEHAMYFSGDVNHVTYDIILSLLCCVWPVQACWCSCMCGSER